MCVCVSFIILKYKKVQQLNFDRSPVQPDFRRLLTHLNVSGVVFNAGMSQVADKLLKSKADIFLAHIISKRKKKQKSEWKRRQREKKVRQKKAERQKRRAHGKGAKHDVEDASFAQRNFPSEKDEKATLSRVLVDLGDKSESLTALQRTLRRKGAEGTKCKDMNVAEGD